VILLDIGRLLVGGEKRMSLGVERAGSQAVPAVPVS
jgi:hypothetical protein